MDFVPFPKIARLTRGCCITEKIDGTNASIWISDNVLNPEFRVGSRTRWIVPEDDNFGFATWAYAHKEELLSLGPGHHFGEWWGGKIQRGYGLTEKHFSLFNTMRWTAENTPACCSVVPELYKGEFRTEAVDAQVERLRAEGSLAAPGFMKPEGIVVYHIAVGTYFKKTLEKDEQPKGRSLTA